MSLLKPTKVPVKRMKTKLRKGDEVIVLTGKFKDSRGKIESFDDDRQRVYVSGVNMWKRHTRPNSSRSAPEGGIVDKAKSLHISNVALYDAKTKKGTRIGFRIEGGKKSRVAKASGSVV